MSADVQTTGSNGAPVRLLRAVLSRRYLPIGLGVLAIVLTLPSLGVGWIMDDHLHRSALLGKGRISEFIDSPLDIFRFMNGGFR